MKPILTERLILRAWQESDLESFYQLNSDPQVMEFFPACLSREESDRLASKIQAKIKHHGWGFWAGEEKRSGNFIGFVGLNYPGVKLPFSPCLEIGWRLAREYWGLGYATEAGKKALAFAFDRLMVDEVVAFTSMLNYRSEAVMQRLGMINTQNNFNHPALPPESRLREHVLYKLSRNEWRSANNGIISSLKN